MENDERKGKDEETKKDDGERRWDESGKSLS